MAAKKRTIYYFSPRIKDKDEVEIKIPNDFWTVFWEEVNKLEEKGYEFIHYGKTYIVQARTNKSPSVRYIYVGKVRSKEDWPDHANGSQISGLDESGIDGHLLEAAYLTESGHDTVVAMARTSGGPSTSAVAKGISEKLELFSKGGEFDLVPFVRKDQFRRLQDADGATRIDLKLAQDIDLDQLQGGDELSKALAEAKRLDSDNAMSIGIMLSFGNFNPPESVQQKFQQMLSSLVGTPTAAQKFDKAEATLTKVDEDGSLKREAVNFISDRITVKGKFDTDENEQPKPQDILQGILDANEEFRAKLQES